MTKKLPLELKQIRKPIHTACGFCHDKHLQCDVGRPCQNCVRRNVASMCKDKVRKKRRRSDRNSLEKEEFASRPREFDLVDTKPGSLSIEEQRKKDRTEITAAMVDIRTEAKPTSRMDNCSQAMDEAADTIIANSLLDGSKVDISNDAGWDFDSNWANDEYMKLNDLTSFVPELMPNELKMDEKRLFPETVEELPLKRSGSSQMFQYLNFGSGLHKTDSRPYISLDMVQPGSLASVSGSTTDKTQNKEDLPDQQRLSQRVQYQQQSDDPLFFSQRHETQNELELELTPYRLRKLIKTPGDLFEKRDLIRPHNYREAYSDLLKCLHNMFLGSYYEQKNNQWKPISDDDEQIRKRLLRKEQLQHIARSIGENYMPKFVALTSNMIEEDLSLQEFVLQRSLLELESMSRLVNCTPICIWRRSGEICFVSNEFCSLTGFNKKEILDKRKFILEFMDHQSIVNYYDLFHEHLAFGPKESRKTVSHNDQAVYTKCNLLINSGSYLKCACFLTARRDAFNISLLLTGHFLPIFDVQ